MQTQSDIYCIDLEHEGLKSIAYVSYIHGEAYKGFAADVRPPLDEEKQTHAVAIGATIFSSPNGESTLLLIDSEKAQKLTKNVEHDTLAERLGTKLLNMFHGEDRD